MKPKKEETVKDHSFPVESSSEKGGKKTLKIEIVIQELTLDYSLGSCWDDEKQLSQSL